MPPKPWEEQLTGHSTSKRRPAEHHHFGDYEYHQQKRETNTPHDGGAAPASHARRWSFTLQDIPRSATALLNDVNKGYVARVGAFVGATCGLSYVVYRWLLVPSQERKPLARRWSWCSPPVPITLIEKNREEGSDMFVYRFALPNSYDYAGYAPVSSVRLISGHVRELASLSRWYTPISHPEERGYIAFAIKDCDPGRMSARLRYLEPGDVVYLGRWMREFPYKPNTLKELGIICTTSGASVALQLMNVLDANKSDETTLRLLYCHANAQHIPFKDSFFERYERRNPERIQVSYNVLSGGRRKGVAAPLHDNFYVGNIDPETIVAALPPPIRVVSPHDDGATKDRVITEASDTSPPSSIVPTALTSYRPQLLICGPQSMLMYLCGRVSAIGNYYYWQGPRYRYAGFLKDMGYERTQVYKFGVSTHFLADH